MKCLVTGARGLLGSELVQYLRKEGNELIAWDLPDNDVTDIERSINEIHRVKPDVIFHLAAWTDVDGCEENPAKATMVNFQGTWAVALGAAELGCKMVYISTDYVFDGKTKRPYRENDKPNPISVYGRSKFMGEQAVIKNCPRRFIVRTSWLFGRYGRNFVDTIRQKAQMESRIFVVSDQTGSPTYARDLCAPLLTIASSEYYGIYHLTNSGQCSWFEFAREVIRLIKADCEVVPIGSIECGRKAPRPEFSVLDNYNYRKRFGAVLRPWQEALRSYLDEISATKTGG
ncbi:MAG: dTDP-4-dehydrorhamnose reductase [candidate division WOR-3 bacterium]